MQIYIYQLVDSSFINDDGEVIKFSNALCQASEHQDTKEYKGNSVLKLRTNHGVINTVQAKDLPGLFDYDFMPGNGGRIVITALRPLEQK